MLGQEGEHFVEVVQVMVSPTSVSLFDVVPAFLRTVKLPSYVREIGFDHGKMFEWTPEGLPSRPEITPKIVAGHRGRALM